MVIAIIVSLNVIVPYLHCSTELNSAWRWLSGVACQSVNHL